MIGTLVGLVQMLQDLSDPSSIGVGMATALLTTLYGAMGANMIFIPMAGKLEMRAKTEALLRSLMIEGIVAIQSGEKPQLIKEKLKGLPGPEPARADRELRAFWAMAIEVDEGIEGAPPWITTFVDMISLLVTFFILLFTFSSIEEYDTFTFKQDILGTRGTIESQRGPNAIDPPKEDVMSAMDVARGAAIPHSRPPEMLSENLEEMGQKLTDEHIEFDAKKVQDGIVLRFGPAASFKPGSAQVNAVLEQALVELAGVMQYYPAPARRRGFHRLGVQAVRIVRDGRGARLRAGGGGGEDHARGQRALTEARADRRTGDAASAQRERLAGPSARSTAGSRSA